MVDFGDVLAACCTCVLDTYEETDESGSGHGIALAEGVRQAHNFCDDNADWITITTSSW